MNENEMYWKRRFNELQNRIIKIKGLLEELRTKYRLVVLGDNGVIEYFLTGDADKIQVKLLREAVKKNLFNCPQCGRATLSIIECINCGFQIKR